MPHDSFSQLDAAYQAAQTKWFRGNLLGAYYDLSDIFEYRLLNSRLTDADLKVIQSLADLAGIFGNFQAADNLLYGAVSLYEAQKSEYSADYVRLRRVQLSIDRGALKQAQNLLLEMTPRISDINNIQFVLPGLIQWESGCIWRDANSDERMVLFAELYLAMGRLLTSLGNYGEAIIALQRGLFYAEGENIPSLAQQPFLPLQLNIASAFLEKGEFENANRLLCQLQTLLSQPHHLEYQTVWLELSGKLNLLQGNLGAGLRNFQQVEQVCHQLNSRRALLRSRLNLAHILILLNQTSTAQNYLLDTQRDALEMGDTALASRSELLMQLCSARTSSLMTGSSVRGIRKNITINQPLTQPETRLDLSSQSPNYLAWFEDRGLAFQLLLSEFKFESAGNLLNQIKIIFKSSDSQLIQVKLLILEATFSYYQGSETNKLDKIYQSHQIFEEICPQLAAMGLKPEQWQVQRMMIWCRTRLNYPLATIETLTVSTNQLLEQITSSLTPQDQVFYLLNKWTADEEYIASQINQLRRYQLRLDRTNFCLRLWVRLQLMRKLNKLVEYIDKYKDTLAKRIIKPDTAIEKFLPSESLWLRLLTHPQDRITLTFLILPDRILIIKTGFCLFDFSVVYTTRIELRNWVQRWYENIQAINGNRDIKVEDVINNDFNKTAIKVGQEVTDNLADMLHLPEILHQLPQGIKALTIIPDDILHGFPFAAIIYKGKYLVQNYALSIAYESKNKPIKPVSSVPKQALVVGVSNGNKQFPALFGVKQELEQVTNWLENHQIDYQALVNNTAHKIAIIEQLSQTNLLHIACHGTFEPNQPDKSGLVLISDSKQQEILSLRELSQIDLKRLRHATLSSCWSADHFILPRRWIISLPETLWRSGTQSILGCLWEVSDRVAVSFMSKFYDYLDKFPRDEALRRTQLDCLHNNLPNCDGLNTSNPFFWAGFCLYGDYRFLVHGQY